MALTKIPSGILHDTAIQDRLGYTPANKAGDTFTGNIITPNRPIFTAIGTTQSWFATVGVVPWGATLVQNATTFDTTNYRYTAQIAGWYLFSWSLLTGATGNQGHMSIRKNASNVVEILHAQSSGGMEYDYVGGAIPIYMNQNDYVDMYIHVAFSNGVYMGSSYGNYSHFSGHLIG